jgi:membrane fusion protein, multidrug efflux system
LTKLILSISKIFLLFLLAIAFSCKNKKKEEPKKTPTPPVNVDVMLASTKHVNNEIEVSGNVLPFELVEIQPEISGRVVYLNVPDGKYVAKGATLAKINDAELQAQLQKSKSQLSLATKTVERYRKLLDVGGINKADYDAAVNTVNNINADIQLLHAQIQKTIVRAPFSGVLGLRKVSMGAYITPQISIATLQQNDKVKIDFTVPDIYANLIKNGLELSILSNANDYRRTAIVIAKESSVNTETRNLKVRAVLGGEPISPGSFVKVMLDASNGADKIVVPTNAIIPDARSKKVIVVKNGTAKYTDVETGIRTSNGVEIISGLNVGDSVVVSGVLFAKPNAAVKVKAVKTLEDLKL